MENDLSYNCIEFGGELLHPSFSVYLFEIWKENEMHFYVGMTGDHHYPSARSILHRLSGHIDLSKRSTQSQLQGALLKLFQLNKGESLSLKQLKTLRIKLHHWPIGGYQGWNGDMKTLDKTCAEYEK